MTRAEHLQWAKDRALEYADRGDMTNAIASMCSDLRKHPELENHAGAQLLVMMAAAGSTLKFIVAVLERPPGSLTRTRNTLVPASGENGVPVQLPLAARLNQAGPLTLVNVMLSPLGSVP